MEQVYNLVERYVKLLFIVKVLSVYSGKKSDNLSLNFSNININELGLDEKVIDYLGPYPTFETLKRFEGLFIQLSEEVSAEIFGPLSDMSYDDKLQLKEYLESKVSNYLLLSNEYQTAYLSIVNDIDIACRNEEKKTIRGLGRLAKINYMKAFEYSSYCQFYSNLICYFKGMLGGSYSLK